MTDKVTAGYKLDLDFRFEEVNKFGDKLSEGTLHMTKLIRVKSLTELGVVLARIDELGE